MAAKLQELSLASNPTLTLGDLRRRARGDANPTLPRLVEKLAPLGVSVRFTTIGMASAKASGCAGRQLAANLPQASDSAQPYADEPPDGLGY